MDGTLKSRFLNEFINSFCNEPTLEWNLIWMRPLGAAAAHGPRN